MIRLTSSVLVLGLLAAPAGAQLLSRQYTTPLPPSPRVLQRLNLEMSWRVYLPVAGRRDGIFTVQLLSDQILIQTVQGTIVALDPEKGAIQWKARVGIPYRVDQPLAYNQEFVFALRGSLLVALDRATGRKAWEFLLPDGPTAAPAADPFGIYLCLGRGRVAAYILPDLKAFRRAKESLEKGRADEERSGTYAGDRGELVPEPELAWEYLFENSQLLLPPLQTPRYLLVASGTGTLRSLLKFDREERFEFNADTAVSAPMGQFGDLAYIAGEDYNLYALDMTRGSFRWRFVAGGPLLQQPAVTDEDVFVVANRRGLHRINRDTGKAHWLNRSAQHFLAANRRFVYATDRNNRLLVLDRFRGLELGKLDTRDFVFPVTNELTDRVYLASHDGLLICLHDLDQKNPLRTKNVKEEKAKGFKPPEEKPLPRKEPKKPDEEKKEEKKEPEKNQKEKE